MNPNDTTVLRSQPQTVVVYTEVTIQTRHSVSSNCAPEFTPTPTSDIIITDERAVPGGADVTSPASTGIMGVGGTDAAEATCL